MPLGRWTPRAWRSYLLHTALDIQGAARRMWGSSVVLRMGGEPATATQHSPSDVTSDIEVIEAATAAASSAALRGSHLSVCVRTS